MPRPCARPAGRKSRLPSVDVLRGLAMAGMILANNPGDRTSIFAPLRHAAWHGLTVADCVFPLFLFLVGVSVALALDREALGGGARAPWPRIVRRAGLLFALGLLENAYLRLSFESLRLPGVLQRIAVVYLAAAWLHLRLGDRGLAATIGAVLVGYWLTLALVPVPGLGRPSLDAAVNLEGYVDQLVLGGHIWKAGTTWDPEGLLSTFPAVALGLLGVLAGRWLRRGGRGAGRAAALGLAALVAGLAWSTVFALNKSLCTSSFVLVLGGGATVLLAAGHAFLDGRARPPLAVKPLAVLGANALTVYVAASFLASTLRHITFPDARGATVSAQAYLFRLLFSGWPDPSLASLAWAVLVLAAMYLLAWALYRRRIVITA